MTDPSRRRATTGLGPSYDFEPADRTSTTNSRIGVPTTTGSTTTTPRTPTTSTVCEPSTSPGRLPSTGSGAAPLLVAGVALLTGGFSMLLGGRGGAAD